MAEIMEKFWSAPPVSRTIIAAMLAESALVHSGLMSAYRVVFYVPYIFKLPIPEIWRLVTPFLLTGGGFSMLFDLYFTWTYGSGLELSPRFSQPGDFAVYVAFIATCLLVVGGVILKSFFLTQSLLLAFIYTFAQENRGQKAQLYFFQIPMALLPWAMLGMTVVTAGPYAAFQQGTGILAAHFYEFMTKLYPQFQGGRNYIRTPQFVRNYFSSAQPRSTTRAYGTSFQPRTASQPQASPARGWTSGFSSSSWGGRGQGHRLGGD